MKSVLERAFRLGLGLFPRIHCLLSMKSKDLPKSVTLFLYGGFGDTVMKLASIRNLPKDIEVQLIASEKHATLLNLVVGENIKSYVADSPGSLFKLRSRINRKSLFLFQSPLFEIYLIYLVLGLSRGYGFIGNRAVLRTIGLKRTIAPLPELSVNDYQNYCNMAGLYGRVESPRFLLRSMSFDVGMKDFAIINVNKSQGWPAGRWPMASFLKVAEFISNELGLGLVLVGGGDEVVQVHAFEQMLRQNGLKSTVNVAGRTSFDELIDLVSQSSFVVTCDAFIMHLASYFDKLTFSLFSFSDPREFVWGNNTFSFNPMYECMPCVSFTKAPVDNAPFVCPYNARCDETMSAEQLIITIRQRLRELQD